MPPEEIGLQEGPHAQLVVVHRGHRAACSTALSACCQLPAALVAVHRWDSMAPDPHAARASPTCSPGPALAALCAVQPPWNVPASGGMAKQVWCRPPAVPEQGLITHAGDAVTS